LAIENELLALAYEALIQLGFEVWFWKGCGPDRCIPSVFGIIAKFPWRKSGSISPYFCGENLTVLRLRCVIAHKMLFSPSFCDENMATGVPYFHSENLTKFRVWCAMTHR